MSLKVQPVELSTPDPAVRVLIDNQNKILRALQLDSKSVAAALAVGGEQEASILELSPTISMPPLPATTTEA